MNSVDGGTELAGDSSPSILLTCATPLPSAAAHTVQILKMVDALKQAGASPVLLAPLTQITHSVYEIREYYGLRTVPDIQRYFGPARGRISSKLFAAIAALFARMHRLEWVYTRYIWCAVFSALTGSSVIYEVHGEPGPRTRKWLALLLRKFPERVIVVAISRALKARCVELISSPYCSDILVAPSASDDHASILTGSHRAPGDPIVVGYMGSFRPGKGVELIVALAERLPDVLFRVVGGEPDVLAAWKNRATEIGNLTMEGRVAPAETGRIVARFDIAVAPYGETVRHVGDNDIGPWMSPMKIIEYMSAGRCIMASDLASIREILVDGVNALLAPPGDLAAWEDGIKMLVASPGLRARLAASARASYIREYTWERRAHRLVEAAVSGER